MVSLSHLTDDGKRQDAKQENLNTICNIHEIHELMYSQVVKYLDRGPIVIIFFSVHHNSRFKMKQSRCHEIIDFQLEFNMFNKNIALTF